MINSNWPRYFVNEWWKEMVETNWRIITTEQYFLEYSAIFTNDISVFPEKINNILNNNEIEENNEK